MDDLDRHYKEIEGSFSVSETGLYSDLVTPNGNSREPIHRWFHLKEAFSHRLLPQVIADTDFTGRRRLTVLDPFSGSGTTGVAACNEGIAERVRFRGYEINPYLHLLSSTKLAALQSPVPDLVSLAGKAARESLREGAIATPKPALSTFNDDAFFDARSLESLLKLLAAIDALGETAPQLATDLLRVALASCLEPCSRLRRDGRTLRYVAGKTVEDPHSAFLGRVRDMQDDLRGIRRNDSFEGHVDLGDVRSAGADEAGEVDVALFSPPYPNNIDYTEVYKLEAWFLGQLQNQSDFAEQRRRTLRSHGSLLWGDVYENDDAATTALLAPLLSCVPKDRYFRSRTQVIRGYADDMSGVLRACQGAGESGAAIVCVVGNSLHGKGPDSYVIASDLLIASMAQAMGLVVTRIEIARRPKRRRSSSPYLRESVVFMKKVDR